MIGAPIAGLAMLPAALGISLWLIERDSRKSDSRKK